MQAHKWKSMFYLFVNVKNLEITQDVSLKMLN